jgi:hypothetical protein
MVEVEAAVVEADKEPLRYLIVRPKSGGHSQGMHLLDLTLHDHILGTWSEP